MFVYQRVMYGLSSMHALICASNHQIIEIQKGQYMGLDPRAVMTIGNPLFQWRLYPLVYKKLMGKSPLLIGKSTINGPCSIVILVYQRL